MSTRTAVLANSGQPQTTAGHVPFYLPGVSCDQNGNVWTVHNWDEPHQDVKQWGASTGQALFSTARFSSYLYEYIVVEPDASYAYVLGYDQGENPYSNSARTGMTFGIHKIDLVHLTYQAVAVPYNNVTIPFTNGSTPFDQEVELLPLTGIALSGSNLYVTDSVAGTVTVYNKSTFAVSLTITGVTLANGIAIDASGNIWVGNNHTQVSVYNSAGTLQGTPITGLTDVWSLSISGNTLYVLDQGAYEIKVYTISGTSATLSATYGHKAAVGENSPLAFGLLRGITSDSSGNFIVTQYIAGELGSRMVKFNSSGQFVWESNCYEFASCLTYSKANPNVLIGNYRNTFLVNRYNQNSQWTGTGVTDYGSYFGVAAPGIVSRFTFPGYQYPAGGKCKCLTLNGNDFFYYFATPLDIGIYRVVNNGQAGPALQLCSTLAESRPGADGSYQATPINWNWLWSWYDPSGEGLTSIDDTTNLSTAPTTTTNEAPANAGQWTWYAACSCVDNRGTIWIASYQRHIGGAATYSEVWAIPIHGFGATGNPIYLWNDAVKILTTPKLMADAGISGSVTANYFCSIDHDADTNTLYLTLQNPAGLPCGSAQNFNQLLVYADVSSTRPGLITEPPKYNYIPTKVSSGISVIPGGSGHVVIGTFFGLYGTGTVLHLDSNGKYVDLYQPGSNYVSTPGGPTGAFDNVACLNAELAPDGSIDIFAEDDYNGRVFWYNIPNPVATFQSGFNRGGIPDPLLVNFGRPWQ